MKLRKLVIITGIFIILTGCLDSEEKSLSAEKTTVQIEQLKKDNQSLQDQLNKVQADYSVYLQQLDGSSRKIMRLINTGKFEQLKTDYNVEFEITNGIVNFKTQEDLKSAGFPVENASLPMSIAYLNIQSDKLEIAYYLDDLEKEGRSLISFIYDENQDFQYIFIGDI